MLADGLWVGLAERESDGTNGYAAPLHHVRAKLG